MTGNVAADGIILSVASTRWRKVAMIIATAHNECEKNEIAITYDDLAARIETMVKDGRLDGQGDLSNWRASEVKLPKDKREK